MHESQVKEQTPVVQEQKEKRVRNLRPYKFYVAVSFRQLSIEGTVQSPELLEFPDKSALREALAGPQYDGATLRIFRGYEMKVKARRNVSIN